MESVNTNIAFTSPIFTKIVVFGNLLNVAHLFRAIHWCKLKICAWYSYNYNSLLTFEFVALVSVRVWQSVVRQLEIVEYRFTALTE